MAIWTNWKVWFLSYVSGMPEVKRESETETETETEREREEERANHTEREREERNSGKKTAHNSENVRQN